MKNIHSFMGKGRVWFTLSLSLLAGQVFGQMNGAYTVNSASSTAGTNFNNFVDLAASLNSGVSGPVTIDVVTGSGPYTVGSFQLGIIPGVSATNTITINGNGEKLTSAGTAYPYSVVDFNGTDWVIIDNLHVENTRTNYAYSKCYWFHNSADNITIKNSEISMPSFANSNYASCYIGISPSYSSYSSYGDPGENILIENNKMYAGVNNGPGVGILIVNEGSGSNNIHKVTIKDNDLSDFYGYGIFGYYCSELEILGNEIHNTGNTSHSSGTYNKYGLYTYAYQKNVGNTKINDNYIHDLDASTYTGSHYGMYPYPYYARGESYEVNNNRIVHDKGNGGMYGIYCYAYYNDLNKKLEIKGNDIKIDCQNTSTSTYTYAYGIYCYTYYADQLDEFYISNNTIDLNASYYNYGIYAYTSYLNGLTTAGKIENNLVNCHADGYVYGIYTSSSGLNKNIHMLNNTINVNPWKNGTFIYQYTTYGMYDYYGVGKREGNIVNVEGRHGGTVYAMYRYYGSGTYAHNNIYINPSTGGTKYYGYWNGSTRSSFSLWTSSAGSSATTTNLDAQFLDEASTTLVPTNPSLWNAGNVKVENTHDRYNVPRDATKPDIGALEFYYDVEILSVDIAGNNECSGYEETLTVSVRNNDNVPYGNVLVDWYENGVYLQTLNSGPIKSGETVKIPIPTKFIGAGSMSYKAVYGGPKDENLANNEASNSIDIFAAPSGGSLAVGSSSNGMHLPGSFDVTIIPDGIEFELTEPDIMSNSDYGTGTGWKVELTTTLKDGTPIATADRATWTAPSGGNNGLIKLYPTSTVIDETLLIKVRVYDEQSGCDTFISREVLIAPEGVPDFIFPTVNCAGKAVAFDNASTVSSGQLTFEWDFGDGATSTSTHPIHEYATPGTYNVKLTSTTHPWNYMNSKTIAVEVKALPNVDFAAVNACEGSDIVLTNTSTGASSYEWDLGDPSKALSNATNISTQYSPGSYTVTLTAMNNGCAASVTKPVYQFAMPISNFTVSGGDCSTDDFMFDNTSTISEGYMGYYWDFKDGEISTDANPVHRFTNSGDYNVELSTISEFGCISKSIHLVSVKNGPVVEFGYDNTCSETPTQFTNQTTYPSGLTPTYSWTFGDGSAVSNDLNPNHKWLLSGELPVSLHVALDNGCEGSIDKLVKVKPEPLADFTVTDACLNEEIALANNSIWKEGDISFTWDYDGAFLAPTDATNPSGTATQAGTFDISLTASVLDGCSNTITKTLTVSEAPVSCKIVQIPDHGNGLNAYKFAASIDGVNPASEPNVNYYWSIEDHGNHQGANIGIDFQYDGDFVVKLTAINSLTGCECSESVNHNNVDLNDLTNENIQVYPNPANEKAWVVLSNSRWQNVTVSLVSTNGQVVIPSGKRTILDGKIELNLSGFAQGVYLLNIVQGEESFVKKLIIEN